MASRFRHALNSNYNFTEVGNIFINSPYSKTFPFTKKKIYQKQKKTKTRERISLKLKLINVALLGVHFTNNRIIYLN